jgi:Sodium/hydrogen exchanger family
VTEVREQQRMGYRQQLSRCESRRVNRLARERLFSGVDVGWIGQHHAAAATAPIRPGPQTHRCLSGVLDSAREGINKRPIGAGWMQNRSWSNLPKPTRMRLRRITAQLMVLKDMESGRTCNVSSACHWAVNAAAASNHGRMYGPAYSLSPAGIFVAPDSGITTPEDIAGLEVGVGYHSGSHYSALVSYQMALAAAATATFSLGEASLRFVGVGIGGLLIGLAAGWVLSNLQRRLGDPAVEITISLLAPFGVYIVAE